MKPTLILINPWIYDFAAYDLWSKPLGLLYMAGYLRDCGFKIHLIDCMDVYQPDMRHNPSVKTPKRRRYGTGKFWRKEVSKPSPLKHIPRPYSRYGLFIEVFEKQLKTIKNPAAILITSLMTYWYPGVWKAVKLAKKNHPGVPVILGGIYARLCHKHATRNSGADCVITDGDPVSTLKVLNDYGIFARPSRERSCRTIGQKYQEKPPLPYPAFELLSRIDNICLLTSTGCPYQCRYCASHYLNPDFIQRDPLEVLDEIMFWHSNFAVRDFAFYDDALLILPETHIMKLLEGLAELKPDLRFHTPNALHVKEITLDIAKLMHLTGFKTIRLGLETSSLSLHRNLDKKIEEGDFERAIRNLLQAGFKANQIGAYILTGLPGQSVDSVIKTIDFVAKSGVIPFLSEYSPIPHTSLWKKALIHSEYDLSSEPLFHNNTLLPCWNRTQKKEIPRLKSRALDIRKRFQ